MATMFNQPPLQTLTTDRAGETNITVCRNGVIIRRLAAGSSESTLSTPNLLGGIVVVVSCGHSVAMAHIASAIYANGIEDYSVMLRHTSATLQILLDLCGPGAQYSADFARGMIADVHVVWPQQSFNRTHYVHLQPVIREWLGHLDCRCLHAITHYYQIVFGSDGAATGERGTVILDGAAPLHLTIGGKVAWPQFVSPRQRGGLIPRDGPTHGMVTPTSVLVAFRHDDGHVSAQRVPVPVNFHGWIIDGDHYLHYSFGQQTAAKKEVPNMAHVYHPFGWGGPSHHPWAQYVNGSLLPLITEPPNIRGTRSGGEPPVYL